jgi:VanZ family protein
MTDKLAHFGEYGVLGALFARARPGRRSGGHTLLAGFLLGSAVGTLDEAYQSSTPGRQVSVLDGLADAIGAAAGSIAWMRYAARRRTGTPIGNDTTR